MKKIILSVVTLIGISITTFAQDYRDLSANYYFWRPEGSTVSSEFKDGKKVAVTDKNGSLEMKYTLSGMQGGGSLTPSWGSEDMCRQQEKYTNVRFCTVGPTSYNWGRQLIEVEEGVLVIGDMNYNLSTSGECTGVTIKGISAVLLRDEAKKSTISIVALKAKCNELLEQMCKIRKDKAPVVKDLRGLSTLAAGSVPDFSTTKKLDGTYYTYKNPDGIGDLIYGECKTAEIVDAGDHIDINSKFMGVKKIKVVFNSSKTMLAIEKAGGHKILEADASASEYKINYTYLVEIEDGVLVLVREIDMKFTFESNCTPNVNGVTYVFFKDKKKCNDIALGEIKTKLKSVLSEMCAAYQKTLSAPTSSVKVFLPEPLNKDKTLDKPAFNAIKAYAAKMGWKETIISSYIVSEDWIPYTKKEWINNSYVDVVKYRQKNCIVFFKTDKGIYKSQGVVITQDAVAGDYSGKNFNTAVYCGGVLTGVPGSGWDIQIVTKADAEKYILK
ncbi:MAG: hypothetical protein IT244_04700 [Bacteroidia bacterium]|nr:hypothetical protein [Bacteroidia bacterium]